MSVTHSKAAGRVAFEAGAAPITLINGDKLVELLVQYEIGVRIEPVKVLRLDAAAFDAPSQAAEDGDDAGI